MNKFMGIFFLNKKINKQFIMFCFVGATSVTLVYLVFLISLYFIKLQYLLSYALSFSIGTIFSFYFNKYLSFESKKNFLGEICIYFMVYLISLLLGGFLLKYLTEEMYFEPLFATIPVFAVTITINFFGAKFLAFKNKKW